jgi:hypothetical protein
MAYSLAHPQAGFQGLTEVSDTKRHAYGTIVQGFDPTYGFGEFIYLKGISGTAAGLLVNYTARSGVTALTLTSGVVQGGGPVAVAMGAILDNQYGWYQIAGDAVVLKTAVAITHATIKVYLSATLGRVMPTSVSGRQVLGARFSFTTTVASGTSTCIVTLQRPMQQGQIT